MSTPRKGQSRPAAGRPRKLAGRSVEPAATEPEVEPPVVEADPVVELPMIEAEPVVEAEPPGVESPATTGGPRRRTTWILVAVIAVLALVGIAEIVYLARDPEPTVSASHPIVTGDVSHRAAVEAAASSTEQILSTTYQDYDSQVDKATEKMTDAFAKTYRETADGLGEKYAEQKLKLQVKVVAQGVVQASPAQVKALLFLNQYVEKEENGQPKTSYAQYRALVTVVHTDHGWLVSNIETQ